MNTEVHENQIHRYEDSKTHHQVRGLNRLLTRWGSFAFLVAFLASCAGSSDVVSERGIQKRKYRKGYFVTKTSKAPERVESAENRTQATPPETETSLQAATNNAVAEKTTPAVSSSAGNTHASSSIEAPSADQSAAPDRKWKADQSGQRAAKDTRLKLRPQAYSNYQTKAPLELQNSGQSADDTELLLYVILAVILPPLAVFLLYGMGTEFIISIVLTILLWLPGVIYALIHVLRRYG